MADEFKLVAVATEAGFCVPFIARDTLHLGLGHGAVVVILAVAAPTTPSLFLINLHGLAERNPIHLIGRWLVAWLFWSKHPIVNHHLRILLVLRCRDELFFHWQA